MNQSRDLGEIEKEAWRKAYYFTSLAKHLPYLRFIGVNGSLVTDCFSEKSDIDLLVVCQKGRLWTCRFFVTLLARLTGLKRDEKNIAGRLCLNCFIATDSLSIYPHNEYCAEVYSKIVPTYDQEIYEQYKKQNSWMENFTSFPTYYPKKNEVVSPSIKQAWFEKFLNNQFGERLERVLKKLQILKIKNHPLTKRRKGLIMANQHVIYFHPESLIDLTRID